MKAVIQTRYGDPQDVLEIGDVPTPLVASDGILVDVEAAAVAGDDWHLMRGRPLVARFVTGVTRPKESVPGRELAGTVAQVGARVSAMKPGDMVFGWCRGSLATQAVTTVTSILPAPKRLGPAELAVVPTSGVTALQALRAARVGRGSRVAVVGASGGVGTFAVQIASAWGAHVTGVCGHDGAELVRELGARHTIDYRREDFTEGMRFDAIIDLVGAAPLGAIARATTRGGTAVLVSASGGPVLGGTQRFLGGRLLSVIRRRRLVPIFHRPVTSDLQVLSDLIDDGSLTPVVSATFPLESTAAAIEHFAAGHGRGKIAIEVG